MTILLGLLAWYGRERIDPTTPEVAGEIEGLTNSLARSLSPDQAVIRFVESASTAEIKFHHFPATRTSMLPEDMGSGVAWGDYDGDGDPDLLMVNFAASLDGSPTTAAAQTQLFRNDGEGRFKDVTSSSGIEQREFGMAASWGDYDNDSDLDLYLSNYGANELYRNNGDGTFSVVGVAAGVADEGFGAGVAWGDYDRDGWPDLYVCNYVQFAGNETKLGNPAQYGNETPYTINPSAYQPAANRLYHNNGDGTFTDVAVPAGVDNSSGRSLGVLWFDFDLDGLPDLYVANDVSDNGVFQNRGDGTFNDIGAISLAADYRGAMGLAAADYDNDGDADLFVTHWLAQENAFFENMYAQAWTDDAGRRRMFFMDSADALGLGQISLKQVGWATGFADFDNDGLRDLWVANGNTLEQTENSRLLRPQTMQLFRQLPDKGFFEQARYASEVLAEPFVGRGGAVADYDGDGRLDLLLQRHGDTPLLLRNETAEGGNWIRLVLRQRGGNTQALGARVKLEIAGKPAWAQVVSGGSYLSQNENSLHFGLGKETQVDSVTIVWPDSVREVLSPRAANETYELTHDAHY